MAALNYFNFLKGANQAVSPFLMTPEMLTILDGAQISYKLGAITKDTGYVRIGSALQANKKINGLFNFRQNATTQKMLAVVNDSTDDDNQLFYSTGGAWTEIGAAETAWANEANGAIEMESFIEYCFFVGYDATDGFLPVASLTGTTFSTSTNVTSMPQAKYIKRYRDKLYIANCLSGGNSYVFRVYHSSVPSGTPLSITWTSTDFFDVDYGEELTGLGSNWDKLLIFTEYQVYIYDQTQLKKLYDTGCSNHRTIQNSGYYTFWANRDGVWLSTGGQPQNIAGEVIDFIRQGNPRNFFAAVVDEEYWLFVGTVTVDGVTYTNTALVYNIPTGTWRWREFYDTMSVFAAYNSTGDDQLWMGSNTSGRVWQKAKYHDATVYSSDDATTTATDGQPISALFETAPIIIDPTIKKGFDTLVAYADRAQGLRLSARVLDKNSRALTPYKPLGELKQYINRYALNVDKGALLQIQGAEYSVLPYFSFYGFSLDVNDYGELKTND